MQGWSCPKCKRVYAPFVVECTKCNALVTSGSVTTYIYCSLTGSWSSPYNNASPPAVDYSVC